ncbi:Listeria-Bacteroides repeat domain [Bacteroidales bacterium Barb7]|nr:Listeria-Bacteroides repeat domain [Bacteroidales bacterium Barb7]
MSLSAGENGRIVSGEGNYVLNTKATVRAEANVNYHFVKWTNANGDRLSTDNPYTFAVTARNMALKAHFEVDSCQIQVSAGEHGWIKSGGGTYPFYSKATIEAVADSDYRFVKWSDMLNNDLSVDNPYTFAVEGDGSFQAHFAIDIFRVSLSADENGRIKSGGGKYKPGAEATVEAEVVTAHYHFLKWTDKNGDSLSTDNPFRFFVTMDMAVQAHFAENGYSVSLSAGENGTVKSGEGIYRYDTRVLVEAAADSGHRFVKWTTVKGDSISVFNPYAFVVKGDTALKAHFAANSYRATWSAGENGMIKLGNITAKSGGGGEYVYNTEVTAEAIADANYCFAEWVNAKTGDILSEDNPYTFAVKNDIAIRAKFVENIFYQVSLSAAEYGTVAEAGERMCLYNTKVTATASADQRYHFVKWTDARGDSVSGENPYTFVVKKKIALKAHFAVNSYRVNLSAENGVIISGGGEYEYEAEARAEASAYYGFHLLKWTDAEGDSLSADNPFVFLVEGDADMRAVFMRRSYRLIVSAGEHGDVTSAGGTGFYEDYMKVQAIAGNGYHFARWTDARGDSVSARNPYEFQLVKNMELTAVFEEGLRELVTVTTSATDGGRAIGGGEYEYGSLVMLKAVPDSQYYFTGWTQDGIPVSEEMDYVFTLTKGGGTSYRAGFERYMTGSSLPLPAGEARAYYADGVLRLVNLGGHVISVNTTDGRQVLRFKADSAEYPVTLPAGVYILNAASGKGRYVTKFVVW